MLLENQIQSHGLPHCRLPETTSILTFPIFATRGHFGATSWLSGLKIGLSSYKHCKEGASVWSEIRKLDWGKKASELHIEKWNLKISYLLSSVVSFHLYQDHRKFDLVGGYTPATQHWWGGGRRVTSSRPACILLQWWQNILSALPSGF